MREYTKGGYEAAAKKFNAADLEVDLSNRAFMITGSNSGIGKSTALEGKNYHVFKQ
jgi:dehydrogenase/reductase SDR family protein 12